MKAYKFRSGDQLGFAFDILFARRLYCASPEVLNDPMEGAFHMAATGSFDEDEAAHQRMRGYYKDLRVCSLSDTCAEHLLWAYYASGFTGLAIEVSIPEPTTYDPMVDEGPVRIKRVDCDRSPYLGTLPHDDPRSAAFESLVTKERHWAHEREIRVVAETEALAKGCFYELSEAPIAVYVGFRMPVANKLALACACEKLTIPLAIVRPMHAGIPCLEIAFQKRMNYASGSILLPDPQAG